MPSHAPPESAKTRAAAVITRRKSPETGNASPARAKRLNWLISLSSR